jgi:hypothetical protein
LRQDPGLEFGSMISRTDDTKLASQETSLVSPVETSTTITKGYVRDICRPATGAGTARPPTDTCHATAGAGITRPPTDIRRATAGAGIARPTTRTARPVASTQRAPLSVASDISMQDISLSP